MSMAFNKTLWRILAVVLSFALILSSVLYTLSTMFENQLNSTFNATSSKLVNTGSEDTDTEYYKSDYSSLSEHLAHAKDLSVQIQAEGTVLLRNQNNALPLASGAKVTVFSRSSVDFVYGGTGAGGADGSSYATVKDAFEAGGMMDVNDTLWNYYTANNGAGRGDGETGGFNYAELDPDSFSADVKASYANYNDAAIIILSRVGGEGNDLPMGGNGAADYLDLQPNERKLLETAKANFNKVIVLINSANAPDMGWVSEYDVDAVLWIGTPGQYGLEAVAGILVGNVNPSGRLIATYATDAQSSPAAVNNASYQWINSQDIMNIVMASEDFAADDFWSMMLFSGAVTSYLVEAEGIYVGYKYYETRYEDVILGSGNAGSSKGSTSGGAWNYADEIVYPFGYGLSYTTFEQTLNSMSEDADSITVSVTVKNTGSVAGKSVVQLYGQNPYTDYDKQYGLEQPSVNLIGYAKTGELAPNATETVKITVDKEEFTTYDHKNERTYILEAGEYYVAIGDSAHDALNNILAAKGATGMIDEEGRSVSGNANKADSWTQAVTNTQNYSISGNTNERITNLFDEADLNAWKPGTVTYLSRSNWDATWPVEYAGLDATQEMINILTKAYEPGGSDISGITVGAGTDYQLVMMMGADYDAEEWDLILDQLTVSDMASLIINLGRSPIESIGLPQNLMQDGPGGLNITYTGNGEACVYYPGEVVIAATFNDDLAEEMGKSLGEDALYSGDTGWYAPGLNIHRTPYSGRNFEYFSEDPFLSSMMGAKETEGAMSKGVVVIVKHFFLNDRETNRWGCSTFNNEQAMRQLYMKAFKRSFDVGAQGVMCAFNRIGLTWTNMTPSLTQDLLRDEWGFEGLICTDFFFGAYQDMRTMLEAGTSAACTTMTFVYQAVMLEGWAAADAKLVANMRDASHRLLYVLANSNAMNGLNANMRVVRVTPWYQQLLKTVQIVTGILTAIAAVMLILSTYVMKREPGLVTKKGLGWYVALVSIPFAAVGLIGYALYGQTGANLNTIAIGLVAAGIVINVLVAVKPIKLVEFVPYVLYWVAIGLVLIQDMGYISNVFVGTDGQTFATSYLVAFVGLAGATVFAVIACLLNPVKETKAE